MTRRAALARQQRWTLAEARALLGWSESSLRRWMRRQGLRGRWIYRHDLRHWLDKLLGNSPVKSTAAERKTGHSENNTEQNQALDRVAPLLTKRASISPAPDRPRKLQPHDDAYFHRQHLLAGMSIRLLAELHDISRRQVDRAIQRHGKRVHDAEIAELLDRAAQDARRATGS